MKMSDSEMKIMALIWENGGVVTTAWLTQRLGETGHHHPHLSGPAGGKRLPHRPQKRAAKSL